MHSSTDLPLFPGHVAFKMAALQLGRPTVSLSFPRDKWRKNDAVAMAAQLGGQQRSSVIKVVVNGGGGEMGKAAIRAIAGARGMSIAGVVDSQRGLAGQDAGEVAGLEEPLELPVSGDLIMVLASVAQAQDLGVFVDLESGEDVYENIRQATAFGLKSVVTANSLDEDQIRTLSDFCAKASMGCIVAPTFSIGTVLLQQAATAAAFHYPNVNIIEGTENLQEDFGPSLAALQVADSLSGLGKTYNQQDFENSTPITAGRSVELSEGVRWHGVEEKRQLGSMEVRFGALGQSFSVRHDIGQVDALMPGLLLAIRRVVRLKTLVYGLEKFL